MEKISQENKGYGSLKDEELLLKAKEKDNEAFQELHRRYRKKILNYVYRLLGRYELAEETTQETFVRVYLNLERCTAENIAGWIYTIARNLAMNELKKLKQEQTVSLEETIFDGEGKKILLIDALADEKTVEPDARRKELENRIQGAINSLPIKYREVIVLCGIQELSYEEAARILNCSVRNVAVRLFRARKMLKELFFGKRS
ncbi:MAG: sigma-70 family RNA polymerase sigma factor [Candidatus Omnitrophica bacterium]|nr:sigma-70 family RNA polymerase sigma factor [Candidatus Omnitrophota bacterium]